MIATINPYNNSNFENYVVENKKDGIMEVQGSVIVCDGEDEAKTKIITAGFADLGRPLEPHEKDNVPRILVKNFRRNLKPYKVYSVFQTFGTVTYLAVKDQLAVVEFTEKAAVNEILKCNFLKVDGSKVNVQPLQRFLHCENNQFEIEFHEELKKLTSVAAFENFIKNVDKLTLSESKPDIERSICQKLEDITRIVYRDCKVYPFGSRVTRLGLNGCDLDVFYDCGNMYYGEIDQEQKEQQVIGETVLKEIVRSSDFGRTYKVWHARVPILKFYHIPSATYGDIAFLNGLGVENTKLLNFLQSLDKRIRQLFLVVKMWESQQGLRKATEMCHFTSYSLIMMATFYLQQLDPPILPPIRQLMQSHRGEKAVISDWPCSFTREKKEVPKTKNNTSILELTKGFFKFYQYFHFKWTIVCPFLGKTLEKQDMEEIRDPESRISHLFPDYLRHLEARGEPLKTKNISICVQDPFEQSHNLTRGVKEDILMRFISSCGLMNERLNSLQ